MARPGLRQRLFLSSVELVSYDRQYDYDLEDKGKAKTQDLGSADGMCPLKSDRMRVQCIVHIEYWTSLSRHWRSSFYFLLSTVLPPVGRTGICRCWIFMKFGCESAMRSILLYLRASTSMNRPCPGSAHRKKRRGHTRFAIDSNQPRWRCPTADSSKSP